MDEARIAARIDEERAEVARLVRALGLELDEIIDSVSRSNNDDEHDPDGATNGYERAKATAMLRRAQERLGELAEATRRLRDGTYGRCERCGHDIAPERLEALVTTTRCRSCADPARLGRRIVSR